MWWFDSNKTKQNKKPSSKFFANLGLNIEGLCSFHCGIVRRNVRVFFFFFNFFFFFFFLKKNFFVFFFFFNFFFFFFLEKIPKNEGNRKPRGAPVVWRRP